MNFYAIIQRVGMGITTVNADYYLLDSGFFRFYVYDADDSGGHEEIASYDASIIDSVVKQNEYTEKEIIDQILGGNNENL